MRTLVLGSLGLAACWSGGGSGTRPGLVSNTSAGDRDIVVAEAETIVGSTTKSEPQLARESAIEQARAAGILGPKAPPPAPEGPLDRESIRREIRARRTRITLCYEVRLLEDAALQGTTKVRFTIGPGGRVTSSRGSGLDPEVDACVANVVKEIAFPAPAGGVPIQVSFPFAFRPSP